MKEPIIKGKVLVTIFFWLLSASMAYGQGNGYTGIFGDKEGIFRSGIYIIAEGEVDAANEHHEI